MPMGFTFDQTVTEIIKHRIKNPAATMKFKLATDVATVANELDTFTRLRIGIPLGPPPTAASFQTPPRLLPQAVAEGVAGVKKVAAGAALLFEWEESGQPPVAAELSNKRASVCVTCPKNDPEHMSKWFTQPVSEMIRKKLGRLNGMNLSTENDSKLGICRACLCPMKLKVHTPLDLILKHLRPEARNELWDQCWILSEK
jgi:hypothetical protein